MTRRIVLVSVILSITVFGFSGCDMLQELLGLGGTTNLTITERIQAFEDTLNSSDRTDLYTHFHPTATDNYNQIKDTGVAADSPLSYTYAEFTIDITDSTDSSAVSGTIDNANGTFAIVFKMIAEGENWLIEEVSITVSETEDPYVIQYLH